jgi:hypothetical protein
MARVDALLAMSPAGEGVVSAFFRSAVLSVFPFRQEPAVDASAPTP